MPTRSRCLLLSLQNLEEMNVEFEKIRLVEEAKERERLAKEEEIRKAERAAAEREKARAEGDELRRSSRRRPGPPSQVRYRLQEWDYPWMGLEGTRGSSGALVPVKGRRVGIVRRFRSGMNRRTGMRSNPPAYVGEEAKGRRDARSSCSGRNGDSRPSLIFIVCTPKGGPPTHPNMNHEGGIETRGDESFARRRTRRGVYLQIPPGNPLATPWQPPDDGPGRSKAAEEARDGWQRSRGRGYLPTPTTSRATAQLITRQLQVSRQSVHKSTAPPRASLELRAVQPTRFSDVDAVHCCTRLVSM